MVSCPVVNCLWGPGGELFRGDLFGGELSGGELPRGELSGGELSGGELPDGELFGGELPGGELSVVSCPVGELSALHAMPDQQTRSSFRSCDRFPGKRQRHIRCRR